MKKKIFSGHLLNKRIAFYKTTGENMAYILLCKLLLLLEQAPARTNGPRSSTTH